MINSTRDSRTYSLVIVCIAVCTLSLLSLRALWHLSPSTIFFANDQSTDFIVARLADRGYWPLLGPPSHVGGRHLGPLYYWYVIAVANLAGFDIVVAAKIFIISKLMLFAVFFASIRLLFQGLPAVLAAASASFVLLGAPYRNLIDVQWHSYYLIFPSLLAYGSALLAVNDPKKFFPLFLVALTILGLSHLSAAPVVVGLFIVILLRIVLLANLKPVLLQRSTGVASVICAALCIPTIAYELKFPSNLALLFSVHSSAHENKAAGIIAGLHAAIDFLLKNSFVVTLEGLLNVSSATFLVIFICVLVVVGLTRNAANFRWHFLVVVTPTIVTGCLLIKFRAPLFEHYFNSGIASPLLLVALGSTQLVYLSDFIKLTRPIKIICGLVLFLAVTRQLYWRVSPLVQDTRHKSFAFHTLDGVEKIIDAIRADSGSEKPRIYARLAAKPIRNGFYYLTDAGSPEIDYANCFAELPPIARHPSKERPEIEYLVFCPSPYSRTERAIVGSFATTRRRMRAGALHVAGCKIIRMQKAVQVKKGV